MRASSVLLAGAAISMSMHAAALELDTELRAAYVVSDNIFLDPSSVESVGENIWSAGVSLDLSEESQRMDADVRVVGDYLYYEETFDPEWVGAIDARVDLTLVEERFYWMFEENFGQRLFDPFETPNAANRENINYFTTGPILRFAAGNRYFLGVDGRYSRVNYELSVNENERVTGILQFGRHANADSQYAVNVSTEQVMYAEESLRADFDINEAYLSYDLHSSRNILKFNAGITEIDFGLEKFDGPLLRLDWTRVSSSRYRFLFSGGSYFLTEADAFRFSQGNDREIGDTVDLSSDSAPYRRHFFYTRFNLDGQRTRLAVEGEWNQDDYEFVDPTSSFDRDVLRVRVFAERELSRRIYGSISVQGKTRKYRETGREDDDVTANMTLGYRISPSVSLHASYIYYDRNSSSASDSFTENRGILGFAYNPGFGR
jgi:hypothetical protein